MDQSVERWLPIEGFETLYEVSTFGRVKSVPRIVPKISGNCYTVKERILKQIIKQPYGHKRVYLSKAGKLKTYYVHRLVAHAFLGPCPEGLFVCHGVNGVSDNSINNLYFASPLRNQQDRKRDGTDLRGSKCSWAKLTEQDVSYIRQQCLQGIDQVVLAKELNVSCSLICNIVKGKIWTHI